MALALAFVVPAPALAQAYQCALPRSIAPVPQTPPDGPVRRTPVAGYLLAASWSPEFCRNNPGAAPIQCSGANGRFGFILHGLWPRARSGAPPQWCAATPPPSPALIRRHLCMTPDPSLLAREWAKHGSCMVQEPERYFRVSAILWNSIRWPDADGLSRRRGLTAGDLRQAFILSNPDWKARQIGIVANARGWLREVRLCYGRDFMPATCPRPAHGLADEEPLKIWRGL